MIQDGSVVFLNYTGMTIDGDVFDTTKGRDPYKFTIGVDPLIEGFRAALIGKKTGDSFRVKIKSDDGYGPYDYSKVKEISKENMPGDVEVNQVLVARAEDSEVRVLVKEVRDDVVVIDGNHPLAGIDLVYDVDIVEVH